MWSSDLYVGQEKVNLRALDPIITVSVSLLKDLNIEPPRYVVPHLDPSKVFRSSTNRGVT